MNRKTLMRLPLVLLAAVLALFLLPSLGLADPPAQGCEMDPNGNHSWVVDMKQDPTCTADGGISWHCEKCGNTHVEGVVVLAVGVVVAAAAEMASQHGHAGRSVQQGFDDRFGGNAPGALHGHEAQPVRQGKAFARGAFRSQEGTPAAGKDQNGTGGH